MKQKKWSIKDFEGPSTKRNTYPGPSADNPLSWPMEPRRGRPIRRPLSRDEIRKMGYQELLDSGQAYGPTAETMQENPSGLVVFSQPRRHVPGTYIRREWTPLAKGLFSLLVVVFLLFVCVIPAIQIMLGAQ